MMSSSNEAFDYLIVGAGIVGLATAFQLRQKFPRARIAVLDKEMHPGRHQSSHNSGVLHSGIYYKPGSLKAKLSRRGLQMMIEFCQSQKLPFEKCGKVIVATDQNELPRLKALAERAHMNQLKETRWLDAAGVLEKEPHVRAIAGIWVPETGIVDYSEVCRKLVDVLKIQEVQIFFGEEVRGLAESASENILKTFKQEFKAQKVLFCAGLQSDRLARKTFGNRNLDLRIIPFRGEYYKIKSDQSNIVRNLIYPVPNPELPFLGVHLTRMIRGGVEAGPNAVLSLKRECYGRYEMDWQDLAETLTWPGFYRVASKYATIGAEEILRTVSRKFFCKAVNRLVPDLKEHNLEFAFAGVRAQAVGRNGDLLDDFAVLQKGRHIHVCNAPSPAATSSFAIGEYLSNLL